MRNVRMESENDKGIYRRRPFPATIQPDQGLMTTSNARYAFAPSCPACTNPVLPLFPNARRNASSTMYVTEMPLWRQQDPNNASTETFLVLPPNPYILP